MEWMDTKNKLYIFWYPRRYRNWMDTIEWIELNELINVSIYNIHNLRYRDERIQRQQLISIYRVSHIKLDRVNRSKLRFGGKPGNLRRMNHFEKIYKSNRIFFAENARFFEYTETLNNEYIERIHQMSYSSLSDNGMLQIFIF